MNSGEPTQACALMGYNSIDHYHSLEAEEDKKKQKQFFVTTNSRPPFCLYHYG